MAPTEISTSIKRVIVIVHDLVATALAVVLALFLRFPVANIPVKLEPLAWILPLFVIYAGVIYRLFPLYKSKWRFASLPDLFNIFKAATVLSVSLLVIDYALVARDISHTFLFGEKTAFLYWILQMFLLGGPRLAYRYLKYAQSRATGEGADVMSVLVLGRSTEVEVVLRALESGLRHKLVARGILSPRRSDHGSSIRGVPVLGGYAELERLVTEFGEERKPIGRLIFAPNEFAPDDESERLLGTARRLGITLARMEQVEDGGRAASALTPIDIEDLLFRPTVEVNRDALQRFLEGKRVLVTGGGGSIGSEICARVFAFAAADLLIIDSSEPALFAVTEHLMIQPGPTRVAGSIADVRDRDRIMRIFDEFKPDVVFHAAALKQVPQLEIDWAEGVKTNVFGSVNIADAAALHASTAVFISTDKAVNPVSILGATKRFSEMYAQTLDAEAVRRGSALRLISVRFGNVLGSVGSVVPKFKAQIARGGPVTVTHPDMVRYFMTVREASDLVLTASAHAAVPEVSGPERASVYVLKMGQPARIVDLAYRMIRLAGFEPKVDIDVVFSGTRKGERLNEILFSVDEANVDIGVDGVTAAQTVLYERPRLRKWLDDLEHAVAAHDRGEAERVFIEAIPSFRKAARIPLPAGVTDLEAVRRGAGKG